MDNLSSFYHKIQLPIIYIMLTNTYLKRNELFNTNYYIIYTTITIL